MKKFLSDYGMKWVGEESKAKQANEAKDGVKKAKAGGGKGKDLLMGGGEWQPGVASGEKEASTSDNSSAYLNDNSGPDALGTPFEPGRIMANVR